MFVNSDPASRSRQRDRLLDAAAMDRSRSHNGDASGFVSALDLLRQQRIPQDQANLLGSIQQTLAMVNDGLSRQCFHDTRRAFPLASLPDVVKRILVSCERQLESRADKLDRARKRKAEIEEAVHRGGLVSSCKKMVEKTMQFSREEIERAPSEGFDSFNEYKTLIHQQATAMQSFLAKRADVQIKVFSKLIAYDTFVNIVRDEVRKLLAECELYQAPHEKACIEAEIQEWARKTHANVIATRFFKESKKKKSREKARKARDEAYDHINAMSTKDVVLTGLLEIEKIQAERSLDPLARTRDASSRVRVPQTLVNDQTVLGALASQCPSTAKKYNVVPVHSSKNDVIVKRGARTKQMRSRSSSFQSARSSSRNSSSRNSSSSRFRSRSSSRSSRSGASNRRSGSSHRSDSRSSKSSSVGRASLGSTRKLRFERESGNSRNRGKNGGSSSRNRDRGDRRSSFDRRNHKSTQNGSRQNGVGKKQNRRKTKN